MVAQRPIYVSAKATTVVRLKLSTGCGFLILISGPGIASIAALLNTLSIVKDVTNPTVLNQLSAVA